MKATIDGQTYDTEKAEEICMEGYWDQDDYLYRTKHGKFFLLTTDVFLDGVKLHRSQSLNDLAPELKHSTVGLEGAFGEESADAITYRERTARVQRVQKIVPMTAREAMVWCIKTQIPECFRGYVLEAI